MCAPVWDMRGEGYDEEEADEDGEVFGGSAKEAARHRASVSKAFMLDANGRGTEHEGLLCARPRKNRNKKEEERGEGR